MAHKRTTTTSQYHVAGASRFTMSPLVSPTQPCRTGRTPIVSTSGLARVAGLTLGRTTGVVRNSTTSIWRGSCRQDCHLERGIHERCLPLTKGSLFVGGDGVAISVEQRGA